MSYESRKGYRAEHAIEEYLADYGHHVERPRAGTPLDRGDLTGLPLVVSIKDHARLDLAGWVDDMTGMVNRSSFPTGVVWHKRRGKGYPAQWYVTTTGDLFLPMLRALIRP